MKSAVKEIADKSMSVYEKLKYYYDNNKDFYSVVDIKTSGLKEFNVLSKKVEAKKISERNKLSYELVNIVLKDIEEKNNEKINSFLKNNNIIYYYEEAKDIFKSYVAEERIEKGTLKKYIKEILLKGTDLEEIKFALLICSALKDEKMQEILNVFSVSNEFLFYIVENYKEYENGNNEIYKLAKCSRGYGRLFCIRSLKPTCDEIKEYMILKACDNDDIAESEICMHSVLSMNIIDYLNSHNFNAEKGEQLCKAVVITLNEYSLSYFENPIDMCTKILNLVKNTDGGIYSLYAAISILYSVQALVVEYYEKNKNVTGMNNYDKYLELMRYAGKICEEDRWQEIVRNEIEKGTIKSGILVTCLEKIKYKLKKKEFELLINRDGRNPLIYQYGCSLGNKSIKKYVFDYGMKHLRMDDMLSGQDEISINSLTFDDIEHVCFYILIKYCEKDIIEDKYKDINLQTLRSPITETRNQAILNLKLCKDSFTDDDVEVIQDAINCEMVSLIRRGMKALLQEDSQKGEQYVSVDKYRKFKLHVKDQFLICTDINSCDSAFVLNNLKEEDVIYSGLEKTDKEENVLICDAKGRVFAKLDNEINKVFYNLVNYGHILYGMIESISEDGTSMKVDFFLSYIEMQEQIERTILLLSEKSTGILQ